MCTLSSANPRQASILAGALLTASLSAQTGWHLVPTSPAPGGRSNHASAYDLQRGRMVVHGGGVGGGVFGDTWEFDGVTWTAATSPLSPGPRWAAEMAYDPVTSTTILFGGSSTSSGPPNAETWRWNGVNWTLLQPPQSPPALLAHAMATDLSGGRIVLVGGRTTSGSEVGDTWVFDGFTWTQLPGPGPAPRCCHDLDFDLGTGRGVLFGGWSSGTLGDTWELTGNTWTQQQPVSYPSIRWGHRMAYDLSLAGVVLHGGYNFGGLAETWLWNGTTWLGVGVPSGPTTFNQVMQTHWAIGRLVLFGGNGTPGDTWTFGATIPATWTSFGTGCSGPLGLPALTASGVPWIGTTTSLQAAPVPILGLFVIGFSNTLSGTTALPAPLAPIGMPGCTLFASLDLLLASQPTGQQVQLAIAVPYQPSLAGQPFYAQAASLDPAANPLGLTLSNALAATIGWQ